MMVQEDSRQVEVVLVVEHIPVVVEKVVPVEHMLEVLVAQVVVEEGHKQEEMVVRILVVLLALGVVACSKDSLHNAIHQLGALYSLVVVEHMLVAEMEEVVEHKLEELEAKVVEHMLVVLEELVVEHIPGVVVHMVLV